MLPRLLIVEDDPGLRRMLGWEMEDLGYRVYTAADCAAARSLASAHRAHLAVLDYDLPDGNGIDLLAALRQRHPALKAVIISGRACPELRACALAQGALALCAKPVSARTLHRLFVTPRDEF